MLHGSGILDFILGLAFTVQAFTVCRLRVNSLESRCAHIPNSHGKRRSQAYSRMVQGLERLSVMVHGGRKEGFERKYRHSPKPALEQVMLLKTGFQKESLAFRRQEESRFARRCFCGFSNVCTGFVRIYCRFWAGYK